MLIASLLWVVVIVVFLGWALVRWLLALFAVAGLGGGCLLWF